MKLAILLASSSEDRTHASVVGSPMPYDQAAKIFKDHVARGEMPDGCAAAGFNQLELWTGSGTAKKKKFSVPVKPTGAPAVVAASDQSAPPAVAGEPAAPAPAAAPAAPATATGGDPVTTMAARLSAGEGVTSDDLATLTVPQLRALAAGFAIDLPGNSSKADIITLILASE